MSENDSDPFRRRDTRSFWGKSERRDSPRENVEVSVVMADATTKTKASVSLNGVFVCVDDAADAASWADLDAELSLTLPREDEDPEVVQVAGTFRTPAHRSDGVLMRFEDLSFESERALARFLDEKSIS